MMYDDAIEYLQSVDEGEDVLILHHWDMDGSSSAAIISLILEESRGRGADFVGIPEGRKHQVGSKAEEKIRDEGFERLIVLDMSVPADRIDELKDRLDVDILVIDHHDFDKNPDNAVLVNPRKDDPDAYIPAAKLCNDISKKFGLDLDWIAGLGIVQDFGVEKAVGLFERLKKLYPHYFPQNITQEAMAKNCRYGTYSSVMNIKPYKDTDRCAKLAFDALVNSKGLKYLESHESYQELYTYYKEVSNEIERVREQFDEEKEVHEEEKLVFFRFESPHHINSSLATQISVDEEDWIFIIARVEGDNVNVSSRCQSGRVDLGALLQQSLPDDAGEDAEAGGHRRAAGASMKSAALNEFKSNLLDNL